jgi:hypothetical protein
MDKEKDASNPPPTPLDLPAQVGYSSMNDNNAFMSLQKVVSHLSCIGDV